MQIKRQFVDTEFGQIHLRQAGITRDKPPLICLHQSPKSSREFINFMTMAANDRLVIALDSPGHGESDIPPQQIYIEGYARALWQALNALGVTQKVDLLGHHTGAKVACEMAYQKPDNVRAVVMISALILTDYERENFKSQFQPIALDDAGTRFSHMWAQSLKYRGPNVSLQDLAFLMAEHLRSGEAYEWGHQAAFEYTPKFAERLPLLTHPIRVLNPGDMLFDYTPRVASYIQNGQVVDYPNWGAGFLDTETQNAVDVIKAALDEAQAV